MGPRLQQWWQRVWRERTRAERAEWLALGLIFAIGIAFRSNRYWFDPIALWGDEALWTKRMFQWGTFAPSFRPVGYMLLTRSLVDLLSIDERVLRLPSYVASIASLFLLLGIARRLITQRAVRVLMLAFAAAQPMLVDFAKEFKPYAWELGVHLLMLWCALRVYERPTRGRWITLFAVLPCVFFTAYNAIFFYPGVFLVFALRQWFAKNWRMLGAVVGSACVCLLAIGMMYWLIFSRIPPNEDDSKFWGDKYGVFYIDDGRNNQVEWEVSKSAELVAMPGAARLFWQPPRPLQGRRGRELAGFEQLSWVVLYGLGLFALARAKRWEHALLLGAPLLTGLLLNVFSLWPWGAFRANLFLLAYILPVPFLGLEWCALRGKIAGWLAPACSVALHLCPILFFGFGLRSEKRAWTGHSEITKIIETVRANREARLAQNPRLPKDAIFLDAYTCETLPFYLDYPTRISKKHSVFFKANFYWQCIYQPAEMGRAVKARGQLTSWSIVSNQLLVDAFRQTIGASGHVLYEARPTYNHLVIQTGP
jgi:hypothetical protein